MGGHSTKRTRGEEALTEGPRCTLEEEAEMVDDHGGTGSTPKGALQPRQCHDGDHSHAWGRGASPRHTTIVATSAPTPTPNPRVRDDIDLIAGELLVQNQLDRREERGRQPLPAPWRWPGR